MPTDRHNATTTRCRGRRPRLAATAVVVQLTVDNHIRLTIGAGDPLARFCQRPARVADEGRHLVACAARDSASYMFAEYGERDCDYVFVNLFAAPLGRPLKYQAVHQLLGRLRARSGIEFTLHMLRHSWATELLRAGVNVEVVARLLTHRSSTTTSQTYIHLDVEDVRAELTRYGTPRAADQNDAGESGCETVAGGLDDIGHRR